jgi:two-component system response regulator AtoC
MTAKPAILVVDDDPNTRDGLDRALRRNYEVLQAESADRALTVLSDRHVDILLSDVRMPGMDGLTLLQRAIAKTDPPICVLLTAYGNVETAVEAMKRGAYDFLTKPVNLDRLEILLQRALRSREMEVENVNLQERLNDRYGMEHILSHAPVMADVFETIKHAAPSQATVLIQGESGTGKELVAHAIHQLSPRANGPFVAVNCAALSATLLESELFGHEKGAFTGAVDRRRGRFEMADGGTLFLDEVSEVDKAIQTKLLRVLETRSFERVGGAEEIHADLRLITATNAELKRRVDDGKFRADLYYRLNVVDINLPPLRERDGDVLLLANHFFEMFSGENDKQLEGFTPETLSTLALYDWPGNVRELRNAIEKMVILARGNRLTPRDIPVAIRDAVGRVPATSRGRASIQVAANSLDESERMMIFAALEKHGGNRTQAADQLGISRRTLHRKLNKYQADDAALDVLEGTS